MHNEFLLFIVILLLVFAVLDIVVGVSNDAVNFLTSAVGSKASSFKTALFVVSCGVLIGVLFSSGMLEVARKGIFNPQFFTMPEIIFLFLAVMIADVLLLDIFNTFGIPTSTTVSLVFNLLGAATGVAVYKIVQNDLQFSSVFQYINTSKIIIIVSSIFLSVILAFVSGLLIQFITRVIFTFRYEKNIKLFGSLWAAVVVTFIFYFMLVKGVKGASFMTKEMTLFFKEAMLLVLAVIFGVSTIICLFIQKVLRLNLLKMIVLFGTFALALAFAANDLVNFIGVPLAGLNAYMLAMNLSEPFTTTMEIIQTTNANYPSWLLLAAGLIMVLSLWFSKKSRSVTETSIALSRQNEGVEKYGPSWISRIVVKMTLSFFSQVKVFIPIKIQRLCKTRTSIPKDIGIEQHAAFDLLRATVNLMVASALISLGTSLSLPLSTTYVTFMVAMGTSLADRSWDRDSAVFRVTGVLTIISSWFLTGVFAFMISFAFALIIVKFEIIGVLILLVIFGYSIFRTHIKHTEISRGEDEQEILNLRKISNGKVAMDATFKHTAIFLREIKRSVESSYNAFFIKNIYLMYQEKKSIKKIQTWANIITANIFKVLRILQKEKHIVPVRYAKVVSRLQRLSDYQRDMILRPYVHLANQHKVPLLQQEEEIKKLLAILFEMIDTTCDMLEKKISLNRNKIREYDQQLLLMVEQLNAKQLERIVDHTSKTRLTILYYAIIGDVLALSKQNLGLIDIFEDSLKTLS